MTTDIQLFRSSVANKRPTAANLLDGQPAVNINETAPGLFFKLTDGSMTKIGPATITIDGTEPNAAPLGSLGNTVAEEWLDGRTIFPSPILKIYQSDVLGWKSAHGFEVDDATGNQSLDRKVTLRTMVANGTGLDSYIQVPSGPASDQALIGGIGMIRVETDARYLNFHDGLQWRALQNRDDGALFTSLIVTGNTTLGDDCTDLLNIVATTTVACDMTLMGTRLFFEAAGTGSNTIGFQAPAILSSAQTLFTLPDGDGVNESVMQTDGNGTLSWVQRGSLPSNAANDTEVLFDDNDEVKGTPLLRINKLVPSISVNADILPDTDSTIDLGSLTQRFADVNTNELHAITLNSTAARVEVTADVLPSVDNAFDLGSPAQRFANIYTGDLHLKNDRGDWTVIEEEDYLSLKNNKTGKTFRLVMEEVS